MNSQPLRRWITWRRAVRKVPLLGPVLYHIWLRLRHREGQVFTIPTGPLAGLKFRRSMGITTVLPDLTIGGYETDCIERFGSALHQGGVAYDIGAHTGLYTLYAARQLGPTGRVVAIEAHPENALHLRRNLALNAISNCEVVCVAVCDRVGTATLMDVGNSSMFQLASVSSHVPTGQLEVATTTIDTIAHTYGDPDVIKMDIEGAELAAFKGAEGLLRRKHPRLLVEVHGSDIASALHPFLREFGYELFRTDGQPVAEGEWCRFIVAV